MARGFFVGGNWKMNGSKAMIDGICDTLNNVNVPDGTRGKYFLSIAHKRSTCQKFSAAYNFQSKIKV